MLRPPGRFGRCSNTQYVFLRTWRALETMTPLEPPLAAARRPGAEAGTRAAELVLACIAAPNPQPVFENLPCTLLFRGTCPPKSRVHSNISAPPRHTVHRRKAF